MKYDPKGDIFATDAECIVNPVNCRVHDLFARHRNNPSGKTAQKGLAGAFEQRFPDIQEPLEKACAASRMKPGMVQMLRVDRATGRRDTNGDLVVANLATKDHWAESSRLDRVDEGIGKLARAVDERGIRSVALPMLGAGLGKLPWEDVRGSIERHFEPLEKKGVSVTVLGEGPERSAARVDRPERSEPGAPVYVAGIGARDTPATMRAKMTAIGETLAGDGAVLRSGAADGADSAFEEGWDRAGGRKQIFLPWPGFNDREPDGRSVFHKQSGDDTEETRLARKYHPSWERLGRGARSMMARNSNQVMGPEPGMSPPTNLVICWTKNGETRGGTGQALRMAGDRNIPVLNLGDPRVADLDAPALSRMARGMIEGKPLETSEPRKKRVRDDGPEL